MYKFDVITLSRNNATMQEQRLTSPEGTVLLRVPRPLYKHLVDRYSNIRYIGDPQNPDSVIATWVDVPDPAQGFQPLLDQLNSSEFHAYSLHPWPYCGEESSGFMLGFEIRVDDKPLVRCSDFFDACGLFRHLYHVPN